MLNEDVTTFNSGVGVLRPQQYNCIIQEMPLKYRRLINPCAVGVLVISIPNKDSPAGEL